MEGVPVWSHDQRDRRRCVRFDSVLSDQGGPGQTRGDTLESVNSLIGQMSSKKGNQHTIYGKRDADPKMQLDRDRVAFTRAIVRTHFSAGEFDDDSSEILAEKTCQSRVADDYDQRAWHSCHVLSSGSENIESEDCDRLRLQHVAERRTDRRSPKRGQGQTRVSETVTRA